jgi:branched-chain amino acid transport system substrate-binding protein
MSARDLVRKSGRLEVTGRRPPWVLGALGLLLVASGCGTRLSRTEIVAQNTISGGTSANSGSLSAGGQPASSNGLPSATGSNSTSQTTVSGGLTGGPPASGGGATGGPSSGGSISSGAGPVGATGGRSGGANISTGSGGSTQAKCTTQATGSPIVVGFIGDLSGFGASTSVPSQELWTAWSRMINASGGINCHPVQVLVGDDGGSTSADASIAQQFVQSQHAIALSWASTDPSAISSFAQSHKVPVVGTESGGDAWETNQYMFPETNLENAGNWGAVQAAKADGATKLGILYCVESPAVCSSTAQQYTADANAQGVKVVYSGQISLTQPDYTANCLQARDAGVQVLYILGDTNTEIRVAQSCARQSYDPIYEVPEAEDSFGSIPQLNNAITVTSTFPWFVHSGSPGLDEYGQVLAKYAPDLLSNGQGTQTWGWTSAKVFQAAALAATAGLAPSTQVTSQDILNGLWSLKNDTLGGLDPGTLARTFTKGQVAPDPFCVFWSKLVNGHWTAAQGMVPLCR